MLYAVLALALVALDQLVKYLVLTHIPLGGHVDFIPHILELTYVKNTGAAFSILDGHTWLLALVSLVMSAVLAWALFKPLLRHPLGRLCLTLVLAGAVGNLIDRALRGFVVDMFNVADICVVVGGIGLALYYMLLADKLEPKEAPHDGAHTDG